MSDLEKLKKFVNEPIQQENTKEKEIEENTRMSSPASSLCTKIMLFSFLTAIVLSIVCAVVDGPYWGKGLKKVNIIKLFQYDRNTILANLMIRFHVFWLYTAMVAQWAEKKTCRVCGSFFAGAREIWSKYTGTDVSNSTSKSTKYDTFGDGKTVEETYTTVYTKNYQVLYQCNCCGKMYHGKKTSLDSDSYSREYHYDK